MRSKKVLLLEAGEEDNHIFVRIPAAMVKLFGSEYVFDYHSTPQAHKDGGTIYIPQGRGLGGSSSVNAMAYLRGSAYDYDRWAALGFPEWGWSSVLPYFRKSERNLRGPADISAEAHGSRFSSGCSASQPSTVTTGTVILSAGTTFPRLPPAASAFTAALSP